MTQINYDEIRTVLTAAGYTMSAAGSQWTAQDGWNYTQYTKLHWPLKINEIQMGQAYSDILPDGFPGKSGDEPVRTLLSIAITGTLSVEEGATTQLTATGTYNLAPLTADITSSATWTSGTPANATVAAGLVTGVAAGTSAITAAVGSVTSAAATVTVTAAPVEPTIVSIAVTGSTTINGAGPFQYTATASMSDETTQDVTATATWTTTEGTIDAGELTPPGTDATLDITASQDGVTSPALEVLYTVIA